MFMNHDLSEERLQSDVSKIIEHMIEYVPSSSYIGYIIAWYIKFTIT